MVTQPPDVARSLARWKRHSGKAPNPTFTIVMLGYRMGKPVCPRKGNSFLLRMRTLTMPSLPHSKALKQRRRTAPLRFSISL